MGPTCLAALLVLGAQAIQHELQQSTGCVGMTNWNGLNVQYTIPATVGGQSFKVIPDSGSFEMMVPSARCSSGCSGKTLYAAPAAKQASPEKEVTTVFGQGTVKSAIYYDSVSVGGLGAVEGQSILAIKEHAIKNYDKAGYEGIFGMGKLATCREDSQDESVLQKMQVSAFSVCLSKADAQPGVIHFGGLSGFEAYQGTGTVIGSKHWGLTLSGVGMGAQQAHVCGSNCVAVIDTGTSLLAAPREDLNALAAQLGNTKVEEDCSNRDSLPTLHFNLGGTWFALPPQVWVAKISNVDEYSTTDYGVFKFKFPTGRKIDVCVPLFMELDLTTANGKMWLLGMPFLRQYMAKFDRTGPSVGLADVEANGLNCASCGSAHHSHFTADHSLSPGDGAAPKIPTLSYKDILVPQWLMGLNNSQVYEM